ncbi:dihydrodipicolinate synthase family protein [Blastopirellula sp. J2-11]|uniref:dihydrodipicolinate synthase family protein n=1 Tax=Blastopirellula sp. J2-11 TaxID=2943192 RepID=UPI0021C60476|nr:dihydrodipicolinate synthase family protein [Blastopirellula sp. J2-11]UUO08728.1 dihydrodipicolinate synthase family protein [Blastopirellula sp. J2-11]
MPSSSLTTNCSKFQGMFPPIVTPLAQPDQIDEAGCERLLEHLIAGGVDGIFLLGSSGEIASLSHRLRAELIHQVCQIVNQRVPVLVGITDNSVVETNKLAQAAAEAGADGVVLTTPFYFSVSQAELVTYVKAILQETELPLLLYNMPAMTKVWFEVETVAELAQIEQIVGIKDSSQDIQYYRKLTSLKSIRPDWAFFIGHEALLAESLFAGGTGGVNLGTNLFPHLFANLMQAHRDQDVLSVKKYQAKIDQIETLYNVADRSLPLLPLIAITKTALSIMGICDDRLASPHHRCTAEQRQQAAIVLERLNTELCG